MNQWIARVTPIHVIKSSSIMTVATGLISVLASSPTTQGPWLFLLDLLDWPLDGAPSTFAKESLVLNAVLGGVMIGWGVLMFVVCDELHKSSRLVRGMMVSLLCWFIADSTGSFVSGVYGNIVLNVMFLVMFMVPLLKLKRPVASGL